MENQFTRAIVCPPAETFAFGLTTVSLGAPIFEKALQQHRQYCNALRDAGLEILALEPDAEYPDSTFVEDIAVLTPDWVVLTRPGAATRVGEVPRMIGALSSRFDELEMIQPPGTVDGGDVCEIGNHYLIGISERTNQEGGKQLSSFLAAKGRTSTFVNIRGAEDILHLKSGIAYIGEGRLLLIESLNNKISADSLEIIRVPDGEEYAANCIRVNDWVLMPAGFPKLRKILSDLGYQVVELEMSEFQKMDGGLSCLSLRF